MSTRGDYRRRDRSWERDDKDRDRDRYSRGARGGSHRHGDEGRRWTSRSRSPPRRGERERRGVSDHHGRDREDERRDRDRRDGRRRDDGRERENDDKRDPARRGDERNDSRRGDRPRDRPREPDARERLQVHATKDSPPLPDSAATGPSSNSRPNLDPDAPSDGEEDGKAMDAINEDDAAMMAMMGLNGFGTTKGKHVEGNQEGALSVKKVRTWRQYMNRRGGFNRPLDKIK